MKKTLILALITMATIQPIHAAEPTLCEMVGDAAEAIMTARQQGQTMSKLMNQMLGNANPAAKKEIEFIRMMIIGAYEKPAYNTPDNQRGAIADFRNELELACYKVRPDGNNVATQ